MNLTRVDNKKLKLEVGKAVKNFEEAIAGLEPFLAILPEAERASIPRVRTDFPKAARELATASAAHPDVVRATEYDAEAGLEDLSNVEALDALLAPIARIQQMVDDSRLLWSAEAYVPSLELYGVAKVGAKKDGKLAMAIAPLAEVFSTPRKKNAKPTEK